MSADQTIFRGDTPEFVWTLVDANGNPFDLTNYSGHFMAKQSLDQIDGDAIFDKAVTVDSPATDGIARVTLAEGDTNTVSGRFISELQLYILAAPW